MKGIKNGYIVKLKDGRIGMVTWKKDNSNIGINFGHYHLISGQYGRNKTENEKRELIMAMGADDVFEKDEIFEIIRDNTIYSK